MYTNNQCSKIPDIFHCKSSKDLKGKNLDQVRLRKKAEKAVLFISIFLIFCRRNPVKLGKK